MSRDYLTPEQIAVLGTAHRQTVISITLADGTPLKFSTEDIDFNGDFYAGELAPVDALNLELTAAVEGIDLKISNEKKTLGQNLINAVDIISGTKAVLGVYFRSKTGLESIDDKITGEIVVGDVDGDWVNIFFTSKVDALEYAGVSVASAFPNQQIDATPLTQPVYNDVIGSNPNQTAGIVADNTPVIQNIEYVNKNIRYALPEFEVYNF